VIHDDAHLLRRGAMASVQLGQAVGTLLLGPSGGDCPMPPPWKRLGHHEPITAARSGVCLATAHRVALRQGLGLAPIRPPLAGALLTADARARGLIRGVVQSEPVLPPRDALGIRLGDAPLLLSPRLGLGFFCAPAAPWQRRCPRRGPTPRRARRSAASPLGLVRREADSRPARPAGLLGAQPVAGGSPAGADHTVRPPAPGGQTACTAVSR
jgi:hypothetical protein